MSDLHWILFCVKWGKIYFKIWNCFLIYIYIRIKMSNSYNLIMIDLLWVIKFVFLTNLAFCGNDNGAALVCLILIHNNRPAFTLFWQPNAEMLEKVVHRFRMSVEEQLSLYANVSPNIRVATHTRYQNSLTFPWLILIFPWPLKQSKIKTCMY